MINRDPRNLLEESNSFGRDSYVFFIYLCVHLEQQHPQRGKLGHHHVPD